MIVITRGINTLASTTASKLVRTFRVATGQAIYPTPAGHLADHQQAAQPVVVPADLRRVGEGAEAGAARARRTRSARAGWASTRAGVGIHGTDAPTSIGYSASHGCIRMQVPDAEWLFEHVRVGTPVVIL